MKKHESTNLIILNYKKPYTFYFLTTLIPWTMWFISGYLSHQDIVTKKLEWAIGLTSIAGLIAPFIIALFLIMSNKKMKADFIGRLFNFKTIKNEYILIAFLLMLVSILLAQAISLFFGYSVSQFTFRGSFTFTSSLFPVWFLLLAAPVFEELAWHSYGTDSLVSRFNIFKASLIFAAFWAIWHYPLSTIKGYYHSLLVESGWLYSLNFIVSMIPFVLIMNWIYYKSNRNILLTIIFHITAVFFNEIFATHPMSKVIQTILLIMFSIYIVINDKTFFFTKTAVYESKKQPLAIKNNLKVIIAVIVFLTICLSVTSKKLSAQEATQTISGSVFDETTHESLPFATIVVKNTDPCIATITDENGHFILKSINVGRHTISISMLGYDTYEIKELLVSSGQIIDLKIGMQQRTTKLDEAVVHINKSTPLNGMVTLSSRQFTVEETQRYAGGMDDPARLTSSFAGVANPSVSNNGISVRGNNPDGLLWRIEGIEVPNPNHFANLTIAGGGLMSVISSQMMTNSDFYTGAFPAEYGNASSGVFDIKLRDSNSDKRQYAVELGILGVGAMAQGPFKKKSDNTYILNYRNSTMALLAPLLPDDAGILKYQDLAFKTNFPTKNTGTFTLWGLGAFDGVNMDAADSSKWKSNADRDNSETSMYMFATSLSHKISFTGNSFLKTSLSYTGNGLNFHEDRLVNTLRSYPQSRAANHTSRFIFQSDYTKRFNEKHSNKTGIRYNHIFFDLSVKQSLSEGQSLQKIAVNAGNTGFLQFYTQSKINIMPNLVLNAGINTHYLFLNNNFSVEPRLGFKYNIASCQSIGFAYGIHSRIEQLPVYFVSYNGNQPNKNLDFMKSSHYVLSYQAKISENINIVVEPYFQYLNNVPVEPDGYFSLLNSNNILFFDKKLVNEGTGKNIGVDFTLERYLNKGYYYMITASVFDSKYQASDGIERNTRFNRRYVLNILAGKEWYTSNNSIISANVRINYLGGNRIEPVDEETSLKQHEVIYGETAENIAFNKRYDDLPVISFALSYRKNKPKYSSVWALHIINANGGKEYTNDFYNLKNKRIDTRYEGLIIPNISYKIEF